MCTSLTLASSQGHYFLARTMDFDFELQGKPTYIPRHYQFNSDLGHTYTAQYGFLGTGRNIGEYILIDGVNEHGLSGAALYFNESVYQTSENAAPGQVNLASHEVLNWILGNCRNINDLVEQLPRLNIVGAKNHLLQIVVPLHWIITDQTGHCVVLEARADGLKLLENPVGVMTNSPEFEWHLKNLSNYNHLQPEPHQQRQYGALKVKDFGPGAGALGLPGDYSSPSRFVRASFLRNYTVQQENDQATLNAMIHLLNNVDIVKGVKVMANGVVEYTQYRAYYSLSTHTYYIQPYQDQNLYEVKLTEALLQETQPQSFELPQAQTSVVLN